MHTEELGTNVPAFLAKLWKMVEDPETNDLINWSSGGTSFYIHDQARFARELLPLYYKHNNMASFVRQLNMYGFHKVVSIESGGLKLDKDEMEFAHQCFLMGHPYLLEHIKRKISVNKTEDTRSGSKPELVNKVLAEVKNMKGRQDSVDSQLSAMKRENEVLWREVAILRQKHIKQQQIVNKLIQFLVSMVQSSRGGGIGMKRHYPLMLNDITNRPNKSAKLGTEFSDLNNAVNELSPTGPVIHELDPAELLDECDPATEDVPNSDFLATNLCSAEMGEVRSPESPPSGERARLMEETGPEVLLEFDGEDYALNPEVLVQVSPAEINPTLAPRQSQKAKGKAKKHKNGKAVSNLKLKINTAKKSQIVHDLSFNEYLKENWTENFNHYFVPSESNIKQEQVEPIYCSETSNSPCGKLVEVEDVASLSVEDALPIAGDEPLSTLAVDVAGPTSVLDEIVNEDSAQPEEVPDTAATVVPDSSDMTLACASVNSSQNINRCGQVEELDSHLDTMQTDLDGLKEILKGDCYSLDANTLLGLFGDDILSYGLHLSPDGDSGSKSKDNDATLSGSELMAYPANLDLADMYEIEDWAPEDEPGSPANEVAELDLATPNPQALNTPAPKLCP